MDVSAFEILRRAIPLGLANVSVALMPLLDSIMLGQHDVYSMASGGLAMQLYLILFVLGEGIVFGFGPLYGKYLESNDTHNMASSKLSVYILLAAFAVIAFSIILLGPTILLHLQQPAGLVGALHGYLMLLGMSILPNLLFIHYWEILAFHDKGKHIVAGATIQLVVDIALNYILIYGKFGAPELGLLGAGIGTFTGSLTGAVVLLFFVYTATNSPKSEIIKNLLSFREKLIPHMKEVLKIGVPIGLSIISTVAFLSASVFLMGRFTEEPLAAHLAVLQINELVVVFILGFNEYCAIHISSNISRATSKSLRGFLLKVSITALCLISLLLVPAYIARFQIYSVFWGQPSQPTQSIRDYMDEFISLSFPFLLVDSFLLLIAGVLRGCEITQAPLALNFLGLWGFGFVSQLILIATYPSSPIVVWIGMQIGFVATAIALTIYFTKYTNAISARNLKNINT